MNEKTSISETLIDEISGFLTDRIRKKLNRLVPDLKQIKKVATAQRKEFIAKNPNLPIPRHCGTDTLRLAAIISDLQNWFSKV